MERGRIEKELANVCKDVVKVCNTFLKESSLRACVLNPMLIPRR